jgi:hypothetical protein
MCLKWVLFGRVLFRNRDPKKQGHLCIFMLRSEKDGQFWGSMTEKRA